MTDLNWFVRAANGATVDVPSPAPRDSLGIFVQLFDPPDDAELRKQCEAAGWIYTSGCNDYGIWRQIVPKA